METHGSTTSRSRRLAVAMAGAAALSGLAGCSEDAADRSAAKASPADSPSPSASEAQARGDPSLFDYDADGRVRLATTRTRTVGSVTVREVTYASPKGGKVTATLSGPSTEARGAAVVLLHGMPLNRDDMREPALVYACAGATALAIDAPYARGPAPRAEDAITYTHRDRTEQIQFITDLRRGIDLLEQNGAENVSLVGISYGATMGALLAGVDDRVVSAALLVGDGGLVAHSTRSDGGLLTPLSLKPERRAQAWLDEMSPIEPLLYVGDSDADLLFMNGRHDTMVDPADAEELHAAAGADSEVRWYDTGHDLPVEAFAYQFEWVGAHLGLDPERLDGCVDEYGHLDQFS